MKELTPFPFLIVVLLAPRTALASFYCTAEVRGTVINILPSSENTVKFRLRPSADEGCPGSAGRPIRKGEEREVVIPLENCPRCKSLSAGITVHLSLFYDDGMAVCSKVCRNSPEGSCNGDTQFYVSVNERWKLIDIEGGQQ